eukprot:scaffold39077_cov63-Phaeocystis_antarctica.AAC.1
MITAGTIREKREAVRRTHTADTQGMCEARLSAGLTRAGGAQSHGQRVASRVSRYSASSRCSARLVASEGSTVCLSSSRLDRPSTAGCHASGAAAAPAPEAAASSGPSKSSHNSRARRTACCCASASA